MNTFKEKEIIIHNKDEVGIEPGSSIVAAKLCQFNGKHAYSATLHIKFDQHKPKHQKTASHWQ